MLESGQSKILLIGFVILFLSFAISYAQAWIKDQIIVISALVVIPVAAFFLIKRVDKQYTMREVIREIGGGLIDDLKKANLSENNKLKWIWQKNFKGTVWDAEIEADDETMRIVMDAKKNEPVGLGIGVESEAVPPFIASPNAFSSRREDIPLEVQEFMLEMEKKKEKEKEREAEPT